MSNKIKVEENQYIDVSSTRLSMKCQECTGIVQYRGQECWKDHYYCPYCGTKYP